MNNDSYTIFTSMNTENVKNKTLRLVEKLPDDVTWDELMHEIYVRRSIEAGLNDSKAGRTIDVTAVRTAVVIRGK